jgi:hypothetical protein
MGDAVRGFSGREFTAEDITLIIETIKMYPKLPLYELASTICVLLGWQTPAGRAKRVQCAGFLRQLELEGMIKLPAINEKRAAAGRASIIKNRACGTATTLASQSEVTECGGIKLTIVRPGKEMMRWREYMDNYHMLGDKRVFGSQIRYMITSEGQDLGCLLFSGSSWALAPREKWISWTDSEKKKHLHLIVNNSRFLLLPWVRVRNLASRVLSRASKQIQGDWLNEYCYAPVLMETFVEPPYKGTSYKAANWVYLGDTQGRGRNDRHHERALTRKAIFAYPLQRNFREVLIGRKLWKAVEPHV